MWWCGDDDILQETVPHHGDHPLHNEAILAGLWGGHNYHNLRYPHSTPTTIIDLTQPQPRGPAEAGAVLPAGQRGLHQRPARAAGGGVARGQVTRDADSAGLIVYMVMKCLGSLPSYMTATVA